MREAVRSSAVVAKTTYQAQNFAASLRGRLLFLTPTLAPTDLVAVCLRFKNEALFLKEWLDYYLAAGVSHFFLYNNFSTDDYTSILDLYSDRVTLIDWPHIPASPAAEEDCIKRTIGRFAWVGFLDADEFVVIRDGRSIRDYLAGFDAPGVALHWFYFGSNGHRARPDMPVIQAYTRRKDVPNRHFKCFVRPEQVTQNRNSHNWFYRGARCAVNETGRAIVGSFEKPTAQDAWINHYYCKSLEDYLGKAGRNSTLDESGINRPSRLSNNGERAFFENNEVEDFCALDYLRYRTTLDAEPAAN